ncbi:hypothetical protein ACLKA7_003769 [Drosophila subpalustris]
MPFEGKGKTKEIPGELRNVKASGVAWCGNFVSVLQAGVLHFFQSIGPPLLTFCISCNAFLGALLGACVPHTKEEATTTTTTTTTTMTTTTAMAMATQTSTVGQH